jgi:hypothetical protein
MELICHFLQLFLATAIHSYVLWLINSFSCFAMVAKIPKVKVFNSGKSQQAKSTPDSLI